MFSSIKPKSSPLASIERFFSGIVTGGGTDLKIDNSPKVDQEQPLHSSDKESTPAKAPVVGIIGAKGGVGATIFAINLACALGEKKKQSVLIDCNLQQPDIALTLGLSPRYNLCDLIERRSRLDEKVLAACCERIKYEKQTLEVITPPLDLESSLAAELSVLPECLERIQSLKELIFLDLPKQLDQNLLSLLDRCDRIILVTEPTISSVSGAKRWLSVFNDLDYSRDDIAIAFNRSGKNLKQMEQEAAKALGLKRNWYLPSAYNALEQSCLEGTPLVVSHSKDAYVKSIYKIAEEFEAWLGPEAGTGIKAEGKSDV